MISLIGKTVWPKTSVLFSIHVLEWFKKSFSSCPNSMLPILACQKRTLSKQWIMQKTTTKLHAVKTTELVCYVVFCIQNFIRNQLKKQTKKHVKAVFGMYSTEPGGLLLYVWRRYKHSSTESLWNGEKSRQWTSVQIYMHIITQTYHGCIYRTVAVSTKWVLVLVPRHPRPLRPCYPHSPK